MTYISPTKNSTVVQHFSISVILHYKSEVTGFDGAYSWQGQVKYMIVSAWWEKQVVHVGNLQQGKQRQLR